jgi:tyrosine-protein kinase Etk/Wzc
MNQADQIPAQQHQQPEEVHLFDYVNVIVRRRRTFLLAFMAIFFGVALYTFTMKPVFEASATISIKDDKGKNGVTGELTMLASNNSVDTEIELIKSRSNAEQVIKQLHLNWQITNRSDGLTFRIMDFNSPPRMASCLIEMTGPDSYQVRDIDKNIIGSGKTGQLMQAKGVSLLLAELRGKVGDSCQLTLSPLYDKAESLRMAIKAAEVGNKTNVIRISYKDTDPVKARDVVNSLVQSHLDKSVGLKSQEASRTVEFVEEQLKGVRQELDTAEGNLQGYKSASGLMNLDSEAVQLITKISDTEKERAGVILQKKQMEFALASLKEAARKGTTYSPTALQSDPMVAGMATKLAELEVQKSAYLNEFIRKDIHDQIDELQQKIRSTYETSFQHFSRQELEITRRLADYEGSLKKLPAAERDLARLMRVSKVNSDMFTFLLQKHEESRIAKASTISNINIVDPAITPSQPVKPQKQKNLILGLLIGTMLGVGLAFFQEYLDDTIKDAEHAKRATGFPLLAIIPFIQNKPVKDELAGSGTLITQREPKSQVAEAFRALRTGLHFSAIKRDKKVLLLTSTFPGEGKSTICANLANTLAQTGARVLMIDCDLRRSYLHTMMGHNKVPGLTELLTEDITFQVACHDTGISGVDLITAGTTPPNPSELLGSEAMRRFLELHRDSYDHIIIDAPPVLAVTDAPVLTAMSDMVLVVMEAGRVPLKAAQRMREMLATIQAPVAGLVVNDKTGSGESYGYYGGSYYRYGYGYGYYAESDLIAGENKSWFKKLFRR